MAKDWKGNTKSVYSTMGASNHSIDERETNDYYASDPKVAELLLTLESFDNNIWECSAGEGHLSKVFMKNGYSVKSTDLIDRGFCEGNIDFLSDTITTWDGDIITNPPYTLAKEFIQKSLSIIPEGNKVAMFLKLQFMEGKGRKDLFVNNPPHTIYVSSSRLMCAKNGVFTGESSAVAYAWYIWVKGFKGNTTLKWFN